jgi:hypothetical protein
MFLSGARDDPARVRILPIAMQTDAMTRALVFTWFSFFLLVLFPPSVILIGDGMMSALSWQVSSKPV